jgi:hypothetical protein
MTRFCAFGYCLPQKENQGAPKEKAR